MILNDPYPQFQGQIQFYLNFSTSPFTTFGLTFQALKPTCSIKSCHNRLIVRSGLPILTLGPFLFIVVIIFIATRFVYL